GNYLSRFMPEKMLYQLRNLFWGSIFSLRFGRGHGPGAQPPTIFLSLSLSLSKFRLDRFPGRASGCDRPYFDLHAIRKTGAILGNFICFLDRFHTKKKIAADGLLGLGKRSINYELTGLSRYDFSLVRQRAAGSQFALCGQSVVPAHPLIREFLKFVGR